MIRNLVDRIWTTARLQPEKTALIFSETNENFTFSEVVKNANQIRLNLRKKGFSSGDRIFVLVPPRKDLFFTLIALFAEGLVPVLIDPRLPISQWKHAFRSAKPKGTILPKTWRKLCYFIPKLWKHLFINVESLSGSTNLSIEPMAIQIDAESLVTMTSGTTGKAKLIIRTHAVLAAQQNLACELLPPLQKDHHLAAYPVSVLQSLVEGATTYVVSPKKILNSVKLLNEGKISRLSGPPGFVSEIVETIEAAVPNVQSVLLGGAAIPDWLIRKIINKFPMAQVHIIYAATEAEPIGFVNARDCLNMERPGYLVGKVIPQIQVHAEAYSLTHDANAFEVIIQGPHIVGTKPHSTGDIAVYSDQDELIFLGRKSEVIQDRELRLMPGFLESYLEKRFTQIRRVAVLAKNKKLHVFLELFPEFQFSENLAGEVRLSLRTFWMKEILVHHRKKIRVDRRHLWKINKAELRR